MPHIHEKIDFTTEAFVVNNGRVLIRKHDKYGIWLAPGGHIELNEDPNQAVIREVKEEVGLDIKLYDTREHREDSEKYHELIPPMYLNRHQITPHHEHISLVYFATSDSDKIVNEGREASENARWFTKEELEGDGYPEIKPSIRFYALKALETLG
ncbi:MAG: NUDIX domain-containing protein [bacterium]|nr:NUDIX domain-containing protein [bacterium]